MERPMLNFSICARLSPGDHGLRAAGTPGGEKWWWTSMAPPGTLSRVLPWPKSAASGRRETAPVAASAFRNVRRSVIARLLSVSVGELAGLATRDVDLAARGKH